MTNQSLLIDCIKGKIAVQENHLMNVLRIIKDCHRKIDEHFADEEVTNIIISKFKEELKNLDVNYNALSSAIIIKNSAQHSHVHPESPTSI